MNASKDDGRHESSADVIIIDDGEIIEIAPADPSRRNLSPEELAQQLENTQWGKLKRDPNCVEVRAGLVVLGRLPFDFD